MPRRRGTTGIGESQGTGRERRAGQVSTRPEEQPQRDSKDRHPGRRSL